jgi:hypothetical protein
MTNNNIICVGVDTAKINTEVACTGMGYDSKPIYHSKIRISQQYMKKLVRLQQSKHPGAQLIFVCEAKAFLNYMMSVEYAERCAGN